VKFFFEEYGWVLAGVMFLIPAAIFGVIYSRKKESSLQENDSLDTVRLPKWLKILQIVFFTFAIGYLLFSSYNTKIYGRDDYAKFQANLAKLTPDKIQNVIFSVKTTGEVKSIRLEQSLYADLVYYINKMAVTDNVGMRGPWQYLGQIDIDAGVAGKYIIPLQTRPSIGGHARAVIRINGQQAPPYNYDANDLWKWLLMQHPVEK
jgi:hypothetical protein